MKICFITGNSIGVQGTPGTYLFLEKLLSYIDGLVVAPTESQYVVHSAVRALPVFPVGSLKADDGLRDSLVAISHFDPDIFYVFNFRRWPECLSTLKERFPGKKFVLDVKTPLLAEGSERKSIQRAGDQVAGHLDAVVTLSSHSVQTWIPNWRGPVWGYPLGLDVSHFPDPSAFYPRTACRNFVYIGSLDRKRQIDKLIELFLDAANTLAQPIELDIYGRGGDETRLREIIRVFTSVGRVKLKGLVSQKALARRLVAYDAGIAWVPDAIYSRSPSLKSVEYMAAGLPVLASNTEAHQDLATRVRYIRLFSNDSNESFQSALREMLERGCGLKALIDNRKAVNRFDYDYIIRDFTLPLLERLSGSDQALLGARGTLSRAPPIHTTGAASPRRYKPGSQLKLVLYCSSLAQGKGGSERVAMDTAIAMARRGHLVYVAYNNRGCPAYQREEGVVLLPVDAYSELAEKLQLVDPDVFFVFYFNRTVGRLYSSVHGKGIPFGMQECTNPDRMITSKWNGQAEQQQVVANCWEREIIGSGAARIRVTMPGYAHSFAPYFRHNVKAFPNPAPLAERRTHNNEDQSHDKYIVNIGGMKHNKNLITLLQAFARLSDDYPCWMIKVFGNPGHHNRPHQAEIRHFIEANGLQEKVFICGPTDDMRGELAACHIHVIASLSEGCPMCVLEAMASGVPSVGFSDCPGTNELIKHGRNGLLVPPEGRVENLGRALQRLMADDELRERLGERAWEDSKAFSPRDTYDQWENLFYEAAEYKNDPERLIKEQTVIDPERAMHARRMREKLVRRWNG